MVRALDVAGFDEVYRLDCAGSPAFVAIHAVLSGRAFGGIRIRRYAAEEDALADALALARAMSRKVVMAGIPGGGAKAVLLEPLHHRSEAVQALGAFIESLEGRYRCGPDYGFTAADDAELRKATRHVACGGLASATAQSVLAAMMAATRPEVVAIQGLGAVGRPLAVELAARGVRVIACEPRDDAAAGPWERVSTEEIYDVACDVFAPCAAGGVLDARTIPRLRCEVVCGAANNPLAEDEDGERLVARGIAYVPDFIANAGATILGASESIGERHLVEARMTAIGAITREVLARAAAEGRSAHAVAVAMADARLDRLRRAEIATPPR